MSDVVPVVVPVMVPVMVLAVVSAAAAAYLLTATASPPPGRASADGRRWAHATWLVVMGGTLVLAPLLLSVRHAVLASVVVLGLAGVRHRSRQGRLRREAAERRQRVVDFAEALTGELGAGLPVHAALERAVEACPEAAGIARAARLGADVPAAMRALAAKRGAEGMARLAAAWEISAASGAGLAQASRRVLETARARQAAERLVMAEVASAYATARLVTLLPVIVLVAAQGAGARPWAFLTGHPAGLTCAALGVALSFAGLMWIDRIASAAVDGA